jgi:hypothetical protein
LSDWSGGAFMGSNAMKATLDRLVGYKLEYAPSDQWLSGTSIQVKSLALRPELGHTEAQITLSASRGDVELELMLLGNVSYRGVTRAQGAQGVDTVLAKFRIEPLEVAPKARVGPFQFAVKDFWAKLLPDLAVALASPRLFEVEVPLKDGINVDIGIDTTSTETVNKQTGATVTYRVTMPNTVLKERVTYSAPVFRPEGIWLLARSSEQGQELVEPANPPEGSAATLAVEVKRLQGQLSDSTKAFTGDPDTVGAWVSQAMMTKLASQLAAIPDASRRVTIQSLERTGKLAEEKWRDNFLGDGGYYAELVGGNSASAIISLGKPQISWETTGLRFVMPVHAAVKADIKVHFDPLIGGGVGTSIGLEGGGAGSINVTGKPVMLEGADGLRVAALDTHLSCDAVKAEVASDGRLKVDLGWISVPKIGAKVEMPLGRHQFGAAALLDNRPLFIEMAGNDPRLEPDPTRRTELVKKNPWALVPPVPALKLTVSPQSLTADGSGILAVVKITAQPLVVGRTRAEIDKAHAEVDSEAEAVGKRVALLVKAQRPVQECAGEASMAVLLGPVEIGPNNEIVRFARNAWNDITKGPGPNNDLRKAVEAADRVLAPLLPYVAIGKGHGGLGVQIGSWKF